jgi:peptidyl-prolyl cis-trans isomerase D
LPKPLSRAVYGGFPQFVQTLFSPIFAAHFFNVQYTIMSIIQQIREKYAAVSIAVIALSLVGFILTDYFQSRTGGGRRNTSSTIGEINGSTINVTDFQKKVQQTEEQYSSQGMQVNDEMRQQIIEQVWNGEIETKLMEGELSKLGVDFTSTDLNETLYGANPPQDLAQNFTDPKTGIYDAAAARQAINAMRKKKATDPQRIQFERYIDYLIESGKRNKYNAMLSGSVFYPKWLSDKDIADQNSIASISYVAVPYSTISDSTVEVSDTDINNYVSKHKSEFKQEEISTISYVVFDAAPTSTDSAALANTLRGKIAEFTAAADVKQYLSREGSEAPYYEGYIGTKESKQPMKDSINRINPGQVYGPYLDGGTYVLAKMIAKTTIPDTVKVRHILVATVQRDPQTGASVPVRDDSTAKKRIDSVVTFINAGQKWDSVCIKYSDDGSKDKGGVYENVVSGGMVPEFNDFIFTGKTGERKIVKTDFGYHYVEILTQKGAQTGTKIGYYSKSILPSDETINSASTAATQFAAESRNAKEFEATAKKKGISPRIAEMKPNESNIIGIGNARRLVKWVYDNKEGTVSEPESFGDKFIVALITEKKKEGLANAKTARPQVESIIRNRKKAEQIIAKIGNSRDLNAIAGSFKTTVQRADSISFLSPFIAGVGMEPKVIGASFNAKNKGNVSEPITGSSGVFLIKTETVGMKSATDMDYTMRRMQMEQGSKQNMLVQSSSALRKAAKIKDQRIKFY